MIYPHHHRSPRPTLNAIPHRHKTPAPDQAERTTRHLRVCQELIEIGMTLARAAADRALQDMAAPPPGTSIPYSSAAAIEQAEERARHRTPDYGRVFTHLSRAVRQTILLETHIAEGRAQAQHAEGRTQAQHAEGRPPATQDRNTRPSPTTDDHPHNEATHRETVERLECALDAIPDDEAAIEDLLQTVAHKFGQDLGPTQNSAENPTPKKPAPAQPPSPNHPSPASQRSKPSAQPPQNTARRPDRRW